ncbi:MAG: hypothetical protein K0S09_1028 [Sphingobacteriaceae bacterium]|jgi:hypothetical protein|nr:hypothetical protein [Sphingobacteriaceae bacterium]
MKIKLTLALVCVFATVSGTQAQGLLKKLKDKAEQVADKAIDKKTDELLNGKKNTSGSGSDSQGGDYQSGMGMPSATDGNYSGIRNKGGAGLVSTPPDVLKNLDESEKAFNSNTLGEARLSLQQAMLGVEMQIGKDLLAKLPNQIDGLDSDKDQEKVVSSGWGWQGLALTKVYQKNDKALTINIVNSNSIAAAYNTFLGGNAYAAQNTPNMKQVKVKNKRAILEYSDNDGYKLSVPLGQSTIVLVQGVNYANEQDLMNATNAIDLDMIKKSLDEK